MPGAPARNYSWEPFEPGHTKSLTHGAYSPRKVDPLAEELAAILRATGPEFLKAPQYQLALWALARTEARIQCVSEWLDEHGTLDDQGRPRPAADLLLKFERLAADQRARLGLDPGSHVRIERDLAAAGRDLNIAAAVKVGQQIRAQAEQRIAATVETQDADATPEDKTTEPKRPRNSKSAHSAGLTGAERAVLDQAEALRRNGTVDPSVRAQLGALVAKATEADRTRIDQLLAEWR